MYLFVIIKAATWGININFTDPSNPFYDPFFKVGIWFMVEDCVCLSVSYLDFHTHLHFDDSGYEMICWIKATLFPPSQNTFMCLTGTLSLAYFIHNCVVTIMQGNRHQENNVSNYTHLSSHLGPSLWFSFSYC